MLNKHLRIEKFVFKTSIVSVCVYLGTIKSFSGVFHLYLIIIFFKALFLALSMTCVVRIITAEEGDVKSVFVFLVGKERKDLS